jgi:hypothetical protein
VLATFLLNMNSFMMFGVVSSLFAVAAAAEGCRLIYHLVSFCQAADQFQEFVYDMQQAISHDEETTTILTAFFWKTFSYAFKFHLSEKWMKQPRKPNYSKNIHVEEMRFKPKFSIRARLKSNIASKMIHFGRKQFTPKHLRADDPTMYNYPGYLPWFDLDCYVPDESAFALEKRIEASKRLKYHSLKMLESWLVHLVAGIVYIFSYSVLQLQAILPVSMIVLAQLIMRLVLDYEASCIIATRECTANQ